MILTTHILGAAAMTRPLAGSNPLVLFVVAIASHFILDAIPHRDYRLDSVIRNGEGKQARVLGVRYDHVWWDITKLLIDGLVGAGALFYIMQPPLTVSGVLPFVLTVIGAALPDFLQLVFWFFPKWPIALIHRFHKWVHTPHEPSKMIGFSIQGVVIAASLIILLW